MLTVDFSWLPLAAGERLLDVGCGEGRHSLAAYLTPGVSVVGLDLSAKDLSTAKGRIDDMAPYDPKGSIQFCRGDATRLPFPDHAFDRVICSEVLEHIPNFVRCWVSFIECSSPVGGFVSAYRGLGLKKSAGG